MVVSGSGGERGVSLISSKGHCLSVALYAFCPFAFVLERDSRVSPTPQLPFGSSKTSCRTKCGGPIGLRIRQRYAEHIL